MAAFRPIRHLALLLVGFGVRFPGCRRRRRLFQIPDTTAVGLAGAVGPDVSPGRRLILIGAPLRLRPRNAF